VDNCSETLRQSPSQYSVLPQFGQK
jgi:hypothetical protein